MKLIIQNTVRKCILSAAKLWNKTSAIVMGIGALVWFLMRVISKPSRAAYPCQQAAFPIASAFVVSLTATCSSLFFVKKLSRLFAKRPVVVFLCGIASVALFVGRLTVMPSGLQNAYSKLTANEDYTPAVGFDWEPGPSNQPIGTARGVYPGRVVMTRHPEATKWAGHWNKEEDQWWLDKNTDVEKVSEMMSVAILQLCGTDNSADAWKKIFVYYNENSRGLTDRNHEPGEVVAIKINLNNSLREVNKTKNHSDASPQMVLALVRELVNHACVPQNDILIYDSRRAIYPEMLTAVWQEFPDVRFMQQNPASSRQPVNPSYGDQRGLEGTEWVEGISYSAGNYNEAKLIPRRIMDATYLINMGMLKLHSYPYNYMEMEDEGQTGVTMTSKNHGGSIKGTAELHAILNTKQQGVKNAYSPLVDLEASPNLGAKTILYLLDGLYCGRRHRSFPLHFPNPPFNNKVVPYENPEWPACLLVSLDGVAIQSVGLDVMYAQTKNNNEESYHNVPRILVRDNADDFLREMATPENAPSGTRYMQDGKPVSSLGVFEHWDDDRSMKYSRNLDPEKGTGIEFFYIPLGD